MKKIRLGVLCPSEIAFRRFMPALKKVSDRVEYIGVAHASYEERFGEDCESDKRNNEILINDSEKAKNFSNVYGGKIFNSFVELLTSDEVDAVYIPLPPALHFKRANKALKNNKHVFLEKPSTTNLEDTLKLCEYAKKNNLALHENYMFIFHNQLDYIKNIIDSQKLGSLRLIRIAFGFPFRGNNDFRYSKTLGGGALLDCGGYTLKLASFLLGDSAKLVEHKLNYVDGFDVDIFGSGTLINNDGQVAQISFGMDNSYKCELEVWCSKGCLFTNRILTAPVGFEPTIEITSNDGKNLVRLPSDDSFEKSIIHFLNCITDESMRNKNYDALIKQSKIVEEFKRR